MTIKNFQINLKNSMLSCADLYLHLFWFGFLSGYIIDQLINEIKMCLKVKEYTWPAIVFLLYFTFMTAQFIVFMILSWFSVAPICLSILTHACLTTVFFYISWKGYKEQKVFELLKS